MKKFDLNSVLKFLPQIIGYFVLGSVLGAAFGYILFLTHQQSLYDSILKIWFERLLFGAKILNNSYALWFLINNSFALILAIVGGILLMISIGRRRYHVQNRFATFERYHPKITLFSLYMIPIGAILINSFLLSMALMFIYFTQGYDKFVFAMISLSPNAIGELLALFLSTSLGLAYINNLKSLILKKKWKEAIKVGKQMIFSRTSMLIFVCVIILVSFSAYIEARDILLLGG